MNKNELRKKYKKLRANLSSEQLEDGAMKIANQLLQLPIWEYTYYHLFLSIANQKEVDTEHILHILFGRNKEVVISKSDFATNTLSHVLLTDNTKLVVNAYGIPEPTNGLPVPEDMVDVVFVPLLAYDVNGNRVGYGKGFYDDFLQKCKPEVVKVGLSFYEPELEIKDVYAGDIPLDYCITPQKIHQFNG